MKQQQMIPAIILLLISPALGWAEDNNSKPNIIYIMLDDAGYGDLNTDSSRAVKTPHFARMAREGLLLTNHYSGSAVCAPTRCVLMTGLHTGHCRRRDNVAKANKQDFKGRALVFLKDEDLTVAEVLKKSGYQTCGIGKWGIGNPGSEGVPEKQGFDRWFGYLDQTHAHDHFTPYLLDGGKKRAIPENNNGKKGKYVHELLEQETLDYIREHKKGPFFLYLAYTLPHGKYEIPADDPALKAYADKDWTQRTKNYAAMVTRADQTVGKILDLLKELRIDENTIVFYTSDNGPNQPFLKPLDSSAGLRGTKRKLYEGGIRAKMAVRWPGHVEANSQSEFICGMRDFFPTACELAGTSAPKNLDGISIAATLLGKTQQPRKHLYWEYHSPFQQAVRMGNWKAIRWGTKEPVELYDLKIDPQEKQDVAAKHRQIANQLGRIMDESRSESRYWPARELRSRPKSAKK